MFFFTLAVSKDGKALLWDCGSSQCLATVASLSCEINACSLAVSTHLLADNGSTPGGKGSTT